jgi:transposase
MTQVMRPALALTQVFLYQQPIDFRKAHLGLCGIIECELGHDPFAGHLYAFTNKRRNKIKCLFWEDNGFVLYYKSLSEENLPYRYRQTARTKGLYLANHCTYGRAKACVRLCRKCGRLQSPCRCHEQRSG